MNISKDKNGSALTIKIEGRLDTSTAPELESVVKESIDDVTDLTFDLEKMSYISSAGLRVFLGAQKTMMSKGKMVVINVQDSVTDIFEVTGFSGILDIQ